MKINYLKINEFGKLKNKEIKLENNINLIYGKNEAGKTTLLKFISSMFYGVSKNKNGKAISDFDRYKPWKGEEFSGKIKYTLDNKEQYEVFREFSKKNPKIYNENLEDVSKEFNIDKTKGNQFFYDQTKIDEILFLSTNLVEQTNVVLDNNNQNILTQKIANILSSGEDNISYKKVINNLSKKLLEEVGTERSVDRPLNKALEELNNLKNLMGELNECSTKNSELKIRKEEITEELYNLEKEIEILKEIKTIKENEEKENEKININNNIKNEFNEKIINLKNKIKINAEENKNSNKIKNNKFNLINLFLITILIILNILINIIKLPDIAQNIIIYLTVIYLIINLIIYLNKKVKNNKINKNENADKLKIEKEIEVLEENKNNKEKEIEILKKELINNSDIKLKEIKNKYINNINEIDLINLFNKKLNDVNYELDNINKIYNNKRIELNTINIEEKNINEKLDKKIECEERIEFLNEKIEELHSLERSINIAKETLEAAYSEVKNSVTPKFTKDLSLLIEKISNGKYKNANFDPDKGLIIEREDGEYINCNNLSIGTIDQLYLSLRLSAMNEISEEKMPIILDEAFAYYDNERLENILKFINESYKENQVIIFTCSNREKDILDKLNVEYNIVNL